MIYLMYKSLTDLLAIEEAGNIRLNLAQRMQLQAYRNTYLQQQIQEPLQLTINEFGKPVSPHLGFNHSHSQKYYALVYSQSVLNVGVDIEDFSRHVRMNALAEHCFHPEEILMWKKLGEDRTFWFQVWTIKEAVLKAHSLGIRLNLKELNTQAHPEKLYGTVEHEKIGCFYYQSFCLSHSMLTVAMNHKTPIQWV